MHTRKALLLSLAFAGFACSGDSSGPITIDPPTNVSAVLVTPTSARVTWTASAQADKVAGYNVFRNGSKIGEVATTSFTDDVLVERASYSYTVSANGPNGIVSAPSAVSQSATIVAPDVTPPTVVASTPSANASGIASSAVISITFSEALDASTVTAANFLVKTQAGVTIPGTVTYAAPANMAEFRATSALPSGGGVSVTVAGIKDVAGNTMQSPFTLAFTVRDDVAPTVVASTPSIGIASAEIDAVITVQFSEPMNPSTINSSTLTLTRQGAGAVSGTVTYDAAVMRAVFTPAAPLQNSATYALSATSGMTDLAGNALVPFSAIFTTVAAPDDTPPPEPVDATPPTVTSVNPVNAATNVAVNSSVVVTFSEAMTASTVNSSTFTLTPAGGSPIAAAISYNSSSNTATLMPSSSLAFATIYTVSVTAGARDLADNSLVAFASTFTTSSQPDAVRPTVTAVAPTSGASGVAVNSSVTVTFSEAMNSATVNAAAFTLTPSGGGAIAATVSYNPGALTATLTPAQSLAYSTTYTVGVGGGATDLAGNPLVAFSSTFTTGAQPDLIPPGIVSTIPSSGATNVAVDQPMVVIFSEAMDPASLTSATLSLKVSSSGASVPGIVVYNSGTNTGALYPNSPLAYSTGYTFTVSTGVKDVAGNPLQTAATIAFVTAAPPDVTPPGVSSISPAGGATGVAIDASVTVTFNRAMNSSTINSSTITLTPNGGSPVAAAVTFNAVSSVATLTPSSPLANATTYTVRVTTGAQGSNNVALPGDVTSTFTTIAAADVTPPGVSSSNPANGATGFNVRSPISVTFSEAMDPSTINTTTFTMPGVCGRVSYDAGTRTATFQPSTSDTNGTRDTLIANNFEYTATVSGSVKDLAGNAMGSPYTIGFKTEAGPSGPFTLNGIIYSGTTCNSGIHVHLAWTQSGNTLTYSGACPEANECYLYPLNQAASDAVGPNSPGLVYPKVASGSGTINGSDLIFNFTLENGRQFTLKATVTANNRMSGTISGATLSPIAVEIRN